MPDATTRRGRRIFRLLAAVQVFLILASLFAPIPIAAADPSPDPSAPATSAQPSPSATPDPSPSSDPSPVPTPDASSPAPEASPTPEPTSAPTPAPTPAPEPTAPYIVSFASGTAAGAQVASLAAAGAVDLGSIPALRMHAVALTAAGLAILQADPAVSRVDVDRTRAAEGTPSDTDYSSLWYPRYFPISESCSLR